jgi:hypothetical protein
MVFSRDSFLGELCHLGVPFLLTILATAGTLRWAVSGRFTRAERGAGYLAALVAACCLLSMFSAGGSDRSQSAPSDFVEWFILLFSWVASTAGVGLIWRNARAGVPGTANAIAAMQVVYAIVAVVCLVSHAASPGHGT